MSMPTHKAGLRWFARLSATRRWWLTPLLILVALAVRWWPGPLAAPGNNLPDAPAWQTRSIEQLKVGDRVLAQDPRRGDATLKRVTRVFRRSAHHLRLLRIQSAEGNAAQWLKTTDDHPFWVPRQGWVPAGRLQVGDRITQLDGAAGVVESTRREEHPQGVPVFNIETEDLHTYFVAAGQTGAAPLLVHNCNPEDIQKLYHYTHVDPQLIMDSGLKTGWLSGHVYLTPNGRLSPLQAHLDLALPPNRGLPVHLLEIDVQKLRQLGVEIPQLQRIGRKYNLPGGELEVAIPDAIPPSIIKVVR